MKLTQYPQQGALVGTPVDVIFQYDTSHIMHGIVVRQDAEEPYVTIIQLRTGEFILGNECQWRRPLQRKERAMIFFVLAILPTTLVVGMLYLLYHSVGAYATIFYFLAAVVVPLFVVGMLSCLSKMFGDE